MSGQTFSITINEEGTYPYFCMIHPWSTGYIMVGDSDEVVEPEDVVSPEMTLNTDRTDYNSDDIIQVYGNVGNIVSGQDITYVVSGPQGIAYIEQISYLPYGNFAFTVNTANALMKYNGEYTIKVSYGVYDEKEISVNVSGVDSTQCIWEFNLPSGGTVDLPYYCLSEQVGTVFDSSLIMPGSSFTVNFDTPGVFPYFCMVHPWMQGLVIVEGNASAQGIENNPLLIPAYADHATAAVVSNVEGSGIPGCEPECFIPAVVKIEVGDQVIFENNDSAAHTATSYRPVYDTDLISEIPVPEQVMVEAEEPVVEPEVPQDYEQILPSEQGTLNIGLSVVPHSLNSMASLYIAWINPNFNTFQEHIDYRVTVVQDGENIFGPMPLTHTSPGKVTIPVAFPNHTALENHQVIIEMEGILFQPIPVETTVFTVTADHVLTLYSGELTISNLPESAAAGEVLTINVAINGQHVNYDIVATHNGETILDESDVHSHDGTATHTTSALSADTSPSNPVDITITFQGFGMPGDEMTGPIGLTRVHQITSEPPAGPDTTPPTITFPSTLALNGTTLEATDQFGVLIDNAPNLRASILNDITATDDTGLVNSTNWIEAGWRATGTDMVVCNNASKWQPAHQSYQQFPIGVTTISCIATDTAGNVGIATFTVTVNPVVTTTCSYNESSLDAITANNIGSVSVSSISEGSGDCDFWLPWGIDIDQSGNIYLTHQAGNNIQKFNSAGELQFVVGKEGSGELDRRGSGNGEFFDPLGIHFDEQGNRIFVADTNNQRIQVFDSDGNFQYKFSTASSGYAIGIDMDEDFLKVFVPNRADNRIDRYTPSGDGTLIPPLAVEAQLSSPHAVGLHPITKNLYVADTNNNRILVFEQGYNWEYGEWGTGHYLSTFGSSGSGEGQFSSPEDIDFDSAGNVYIVDTGNDRIQVFSTSLNATDNFITSLSHSSLDMPRGIAVSDSLNKVYLTNYANHDIVTFSFDMPLVPDGVTYITSTNSTSTNSTSTQTTNSTSTQTTNSTSTNSTSSISSYTRSEVGKWINGEITSNSFLLTLNTALATGEFDTVTSLGNFPALVDPGGADHIALSLSGHDQLNTGWMRVDIEQWHAEIRDDSWLLNVVEALVAETRWDVIVDASGNYMAEERQAGGIYSFELGAQPGNNPDDYGIDVHHVWIDKGTSNEIFSWFDHETGGCISGSNFVWNGYDVTNHIDNSVSTCSIGIAVTNPSTDVYQLILNANFLPEGEHTLTWNTVAWIDAGNGAGTRTLAGQYTLLIVK
jgi:DNA-binding beta-propeller fold protein YncE/plastocyanin